MNRRAITLVNVAAAAAAFSVAAAVALSHRGPAVTTLIGAGVQTYERKQVRERAAASPVGDAKMVMDASGRHVAVRPWQRIVSTSWLGDSLLVELCEPDRVAAFTEVSRRDSVYRHRFAGKPAVDGLGPLEPIISLGPDLVVVNSLSDPARITRLRDTGIEVFELGGLRGVASVVEAAERLAAVLGVPDRGVALGRALVQRMARVATPLGTTPRRRALYVSFISGHLFGGTRGTSYHDVLTAAGLVDVAADKFDGWPEYSIEQLIELAPEVVVMKAGMRRALCGHPVLGRLAACTGSNGVLELSQGLLEDPGPAMLDAAEALFRMAYPQFDLPPANDGRSAPQ